MRVVFGRLCICQARDEGSGRNGYGEWQGTISYLLWKYLRCCWLFWRIRNNARILDELGKGSARCMISATTVADFHDSRLCKIADKMQTGLYRSRSMQNCKQIMKNVAHYRARRLLCPNRDIQTHVWQAT